MLNFHCLSPFLPPPPKRERLSVVSNVQTPQRGISLHICSFLTDKNFNQMFLYSKDFSFDLQLVGGSNQGECHEEDKRKVKHSVNNLVSITLKGLPVTFNLAFLKREKKRSDY